MHYMGGKFRQANGIAKTLLDNHGTGFVYIEPFCGALGSASKVCDMCKPVSVGLFDINNPLILLWKSIIENGFIPPCVITDEQYNNYKNKRDDNDPLTAWYGIACSFRGKWFGGLARRTKGVCKSYDFTSQVKSTLKKAESIKQISNVRMECISYTDLYIPDGAVVYCDPPYEGRTKAHHFDSFDYMEFWQWVRDLSKRCHVYTSCFDCPDDFYSVYEWGDTVVGHRNGKGTDGTNERLVIYREV